MQPIPSLPTEVQLPFNALVFPLAPVVEVQASTKVSDVLGTFRANRDALSLPVFDTENEVYLGWVSLIDFLKVFLELDDKLRNTDTTSKTTQQVLAIANELPSGISPESSLLECFEKNVCPVYKFIPIERETRLPEILRLLSQSKVKKLAVIHPTTKRIENIISQKTIIDLLCTSLKKIEINALNFFEEGNVLEQQDLKIFDKTVDELQYLKPVVMISEDQTLLDACKLMARDSVTALVIVDETGCVCNQISIKDLATVMNFDFTWFRPFLNRAGGGSPIMDENVLDFISRLRQQELTNAARTPAIVVAVKRNSKLKKVVGRLSTSHNNRVFVTQRKQAVGVVSLRDVIKSLVEFKV